MGTSVPGVWSERDLHIAVQRLVDAAYGRVTDAPAAFHIPAQPTDADVMLHDAICELVERRAKARTMETTECVLARLARYYHERTQAAQRLMNQTIDLEVAACHATSALYWDVRWQTVIQVAKNLGIALPERETL